MSIAKYLDDLEARIDDSVESRLWDQWRQFCGLRLEGGLFLPARPAPNPPKVPWPTVAINQALNDFDSMALQQFAACSADLDKANGCVLDVRCNYGTPIMPVLFGCELFIMPGEMNTLPAARPVPGGADGIRAIMDRGVPSLHHPYVRKVFEMGRRFMAVKKAYPRIGQHVHLYHPDTQGPMDILEMIWGSGIFISLYEHPELVHAMLDLITETYIHFMREWETICPPPPGGLATHWGMVHKGRIMLRDDSAMNLSPEMLDRFIRPYDQRLLLEFGGGAVHACGRVDHFIPFVPLMRGLHVFNMSQPELNNMETVWRHTVDRGIAIIGMNRTTADVALAAGRTLHGRVHCH